MEEKLEDVLFEVHREVVTALGLAGQPIGKFAADSCPSIQKNPRLSLGLIIAPWDAGNYHIEFRYHPTEKEELNKIHGHPAYTFDAPSIGARTAIEDIHPDGFLFWGGDHMGTHILVKTNSLTITNSTSRFNKNGSGGFDSSDHVKTSTTYDRRGQIVEPIKITLRSPHFPGIDLDFYYYERDDCNKPNRRTRWVVHTDAKVLRRRKVLVPQELKVVNSMLTSEEDAIGVLPGTLYRIPSVPMALEPNVSGYVRKLCLPLINAARGG